MTPPSARRVAAVLAAAVLGVSIAGTLVRLAPGAPPLALAFWRSLIAACVLAPAIRRLSHRDLLLTALPTVTILKTARYLQEEPGRDPSGEIDVLARLEKNLQDAPLAGFVAEGTAPFARMTDAVTAAIRRAALSGMPTVRVARGNAEGFAPPNPRDLTIAGSNLTATKARMLLMACLMKLGSLPPTADPDHPTDGELAATRAKLAEYQAIFDTH